MSPKIQKLIDAVLFGGTALLVFAALYLVFMIVPNERVMGPVQRIFYFHVGSAMACYCSFAVMLVAALLYLATRAWKFDVVMQAAGETSLVFCTIVLASGMIWGRSAWNTWFRWEPRLVSFLMLWLISLSFNVLRLFGDPRRVAAHSAVLGIVGALTVPLVIFSIKLLPQFAQLHPQIVENRGLKDTSFIVAMFFTIAALVLLQFELLWLRYRIGVCEHEYLKEA